MSNVQNSMNVSNIQWAMRLKVFPFSFFLSVFFIFSFLFFSFLFSHCGKREQWESVFPYFFFSFLVLHLFFFFFFVFFVFSHSCSWKKRAMRLSLSLFIFFFLRSSSFLFFSYLFSFYVLFVFFCSFRPCLFLADLAGPAIDHFVLSSCTSSFLFFFCLSFLAFLPFTFQVKGEKLSGKVNFPAIHLSAVPDNF